MREHQIQTAIKNLLEYRGFFVMRNNAGAIRATNRYGKQHMVRLSEIGTPDLMAFKPSDEDASSVKLYFIEVKVPGNKPTFAQEQMMKRLKEYTPHVFVAHSIEEVEDYFGWEHK